jgi:CHAT domain-containing protein
VVRAGVPRVLARQAPVSDGYATALTAAFYRHLADDDAPTAGRALADARRATLGDAGAERATATLVVAGDRHAGRRGRRPAARR